MTLEWVLRLAATGVVASSTVYLGWSLANSRVRPRFVWLYLFITLVLLTTFRFLVTLMTAGIIDGDFAGGIEEVQATINQALYMMVGFAVILLVRAHIVGLANHNKLEHGDDDG